MAGGYDSVEFLARKCFAPGSAHLLAARSRMSASAAVDDVAVVALKEENGRSNNVGYPLVLDFSQSICV